MFGSEILEVAAGLTFFFLLASLLCTALLEALEGFWRGRARALEQGLHLLLQEPQHVEAIYNHALISGLYIGKYRADKRQPTQESGTAAPSDKPQLPTYIPTPLFATALLDLLIRTSSDPEAATQPTRLDMPALRAAAVAHRDSAAGQMLFALVNTAGSDVASILKGVEAWFDGAMDRVSGRYKRRTQTLLFWAGLATAAALNLDAITITQALARDHALRAVAVAQAEKATAPSAANDDEDAGARAAALSNQIREIGYPVGWKAGWPKPQSELRVDAQGQCVRAPARSKPSTLPTPPLRALANGFASEPNSQGCRYQLGWRVVPMILGWLATALAVMLGAPFWFDVLNRIMIVRSTIKPDQKSPPEAPPEGYPPGYPHVGPTPLAAGRPDDPPPAVTRNQ
jgi:hypothetical protein